MIIYEKTWATDHPICLKRYEQGVLQRLYKIWWMPCIWKKNRNGCNGFRKITLFWLEEVYFDNTDRQKRKCEILYRKVRLFDTVWRNGWECQSCAICFGKIYLFVRDEISHSWDVQDKRVTISASDVLREGVGICWAKANLFAALLRVNGVPAEFSIEDEKLAFINLVSSGFAS